MTAGQLVRLWCGGEGNPPPTVRWFMAPHKTLGPFSEVTTSEDARVLVTEESLVIVAASVADQGKYFCIISSSLGSRMSSTAFLRVYSECVCMCVWGCVCVHMYIFAMTMSLSEYFLTIYDYHYLLRFASPPSHPHTAAPPIIPPLPTEFRASVGRRHLVFDCFGSGDPAPVTNWIRDRATILPITGRHVCTCSYHVIVT